MNLTVKRFVVGGMRNNCYLVYDAHSKKAFLVDASSPCEEIMRFISHEELHLDFIILTHGHFDHIADVECFNVPFYIHEADAEFLTDPRINASLFCGNPISVKAHPIIVNSNTVLDFEGNNIEIIHTPGHTPGGICLKIEHWLFSGDTLFYRSVGRTDIPLSSHDDIISSIQFKLFALPDNTKVFPGHGEETTIGYEKAHNPFLR